MNAFPRLRNGLFAALLFVSASASAREIAGVDVPESVTVEGKTLKLNGAGMRKKFIIKVYVGALYLEANSTDAAAILSADSVRQVRMTFLRSVDKEKIVGAYKEGFEKNSKDKAAALQGGLDKIAAALPAEVKSGQEMWVTYVPSKGTTIAVKDGPSVTIPGKDFGDALLRNWLGPEPADAGLKKELLKGEAK